MAFLSIRGNRNTRHTFSRILCTYGEGTHRPFCTCQSILLSAAFFPRKRYNFYTSYFTVFLELSRAFWRQVFNHEYTRRRNGHYSAIGSSSDLKPPMPFLLGLCPILYGYKAQSSQGQRRTSAGWLHIQFKHLALIAFNGLNMAHSSGGNNSAYFSTISFALLDSPSGSTCSVTTFCVSIMSKWAFSHQMPTTGLISPVTIQASIPA